MRESEHIYRSFKGSKISIFYGAYIAGFMNVKSRQPITYSDI